MGSLTLLGGSESDVSKTPLKLPIQPPRAYSVRDAYDRRVWRTPGAVVSRELFFWAVGVLALGVVYQAPTLVTYGLLGVVLCAMMGFGLSWSKNRGRARLIRTGLPARATLSHPRRVPFLHELFRGQRESTYVMEYTFCAENGDEHSGRLWICGCARNYLPPKSLEWVVYDAQAPQDSVPLRAAVMVAPH